MATDGGFLPLQLDDVPDILNGIAEFTARHASTEAVITYTDSVVLEAVGEIVITFGHCTNKNANALLWSYVCNIVFDPDNVSIVAERDLPAVGWKMVSDWILDDLE